MLVKANTSFSGVSFNMAKGEVKECSDEAILQDLLSCGYVKEVKPEVTVQVKKPKEVKPQKPPKGGKANESKSNTGK
jgi:hypothetical protein